MPGLAPWLKFYLENQDRKSRKSWLAGLGIACGWRGEAGGTPLDWARGGLPRSQRPLLRGGAGAAAGQC